MNITVSPRRAAIVVLAILTLTFVYVIGATRSGGAAAAAATTPSPTAGAAAAPGISVVGRADVAGTPDTLRLDLSVTATANSVTEALASANRSAAAVQKSLLANGVQKKDLQTSGLNIQPDYEYLKSGTPRIKGYAVSQSVTAKLRNLATAGAAIGKAVTAGGNAVRVNGISLDLEDTGALASSARDKAFSDAKAKAEQYAKAAGRSLGAVVSIAEDVATSPPTPVPYAADVRADSAAVPIQPGSQNVTVSVTVVFAMT